ncbi:hypothetical protein [Micromonospora robiginosa]|uniref:DUF2637 domain-containing protein n=2 Tax=Micromonospora robiginosa TaxID=2749844 RepID=A0A7L6B7X6_9ACTN|nr:hypothetical protein [Micromonospora ferruginea]QLQ38014.2 hypothetical protein H1D33_03725 [Micromonospora ferruginea]
MTLFRPRRTAEEFAAAARAQDERRRLQAQFDRDQAAAHRAERRRLDRERARADRKRRKARAKARARFWHRIGAGLRAARTIAPLLLVNAAAVGGQTGYAITRTPESWPAPARLAVALVYAATVESIALYVNWHAHDALMHRATGTATEMRRRAYLIAAVVAAMNYSHFDGEHWTPTPFAVGSGMASLLSPWLWGLHTRRAQQLQLLRADLVDETGAVFDRKRRRAFPIRTWRAERWSIEHHIRDPRVAWDGYHAERAACRAQVRPGRLGSAWAALRGRAVAIQPPAPKRASVLDESDPGVRECRKLARSMESATQGLRPRLARIAVADWSLGLWPASGRRGGQSGGQPPASGRPPAPAGPASPPPEPPEPPATPPRRPAAGRQRHREGRRRLRRAAEGDRPAAVRPAGGQARQGQQDHGQRLAQRASQEEVEAPRGAANAWTARRAPGPSPEGRTSIMPTHHALPGQPPPDAPAGQLLRMNVDPTVIQPRRVPWTLILAADLVGVLAALATGLAARLAGHLTVTAVAGIVMVLLGVALFPITTHREMDR